MSPTEAETLSQLIAALARYAAEEVACPNDTTRTNRELARVDLREALRELDPWMEPITRWPKVVE